MRAFQSPDGVRWMVEVQLPGSSNAMVVFHHPNGLSTRQDRYAWYNANTPEAKSVTSHLDAAKIEQSFTEAQLALLFRRSMLISAADNPLNIPVTQFAV
jgi:hypothetical protein